METVQFINPEGQQVEVPAHEAHLFDDMGWERAEGAAAKPKKAANKK